MHDMRKVENAMTKKVVLPVSPHLGESTQDLHQVQYFGQGYAVDPLSLIVRVNLRSV